MKHEYIYLVYEREFIKTAEPIYKLGKTKQINTKRFNQYPKSSILILQLYVSNCDKLENKLIKILKNNFTQRVRTNKSFLTQRKDIGTEYFEGDIDEIKKIVFNICNLCDLNKMNNSEDNINVITNIINKNKYDSNIRKRKPSTIYYDI